MCLTPASDVAWFTLFAHIKPLRTGDFDPTQRRGVALHSTHPDHLVGRGYPGCADVQVRADPGKLLVGTHHAIISWDSATNIATIKDQSLNGTWVNGVKVPSHGSIELTDNAVIWLGPPLQHESCGLVFECALNRNALLKKYKFDFTLGSGGFGDVYQMRLRYDPGKVVAMKVARFDPDDAEDAWTENDAMKEVQALMDAQGHPNICPIEEYYVERMSIFVVLPRLSTDLRRHFSGVRPTLSEAQTMLKQLVSAVAHIQISHMVHRDIKPENVFVLTANPLRVVLADFGLAYKVDLPGKDIPASYLRGGTAWYMAPELVGNDVMEYVYKIDCFSVAITVIYLLMGKLAFGPWNMRYPRDQERTLATERFYFANRHIRWDRLEQLSMPENALQVLQGLSNPYPEERWDVQRALDWDWVADACDQSGKAIVARETVRYVAQDAIASVKLETATRPSQVQVTEAKIAKAKVAQTKQSLANGVDVRRRSPRLEEKEAQKHHGRKLRKRRA